MAYHQTKFNLSKTQLKKIASAVQKNEEFTLRLGKSDINHQGYNLPLTRTQLNKLSDGNLHDIKFSVAQVKHISTKLNVKSGGLLPLVTLIPLIASVLGGVSGVAGTVAGAVQKAQANREQERHNKELEKQLGKGLRL